MQAVDSDKIISFDAAKRSADEKRKKRPNAKLEACEVAALRDLGRYVILTASLFGVSAGYQESSASDGLGGLFDKGLVDRGYYFTPRTEEEIALARPRPPQGPAYKLTRDGIKRGIREGVVDPDAYSIRKLWNGSAPNDMQHRLLIVEMMIRTRLDVAKQSRLCVGRTLFDFVRRNNVRVTKDMISPDVFIVPDLVFELENFLGGQSTLLFCEIENTKLQPSSNDKNRATIARKLQPYGEYLRSAHRKISGADQDLILYVMNQPAAHLDEVIKHVPWDEVGDVRVLVRMTTFDDIREHGVLNGRWRNHSGETVGIVAS